MHDQIDQRGFTGAGSAHNADHLAHLDLKIYFFQDRFVGTVAEGNILKYHISLYLPAYRIFPVPYLRLFIQHIVDTFQAG